MFITPNRRNDFVLRNSLPRPARKHLDQTSKGNLPLALGLGAILLGIVIAVNALAYLVRETAVRRYG